MVGQPMEVEGAPLQMLPLTSAHRGPLSVACTQCAEGRKMVLFVTGLCRFRCFYCPVSPNRNQRDVTYANERKVGRDEDVLEEARSIGASGTGITGGDPLGCVDRVEHYVRLLKTEFGAEHHIHLYTHEPNAAKLAQLAAAGLDEFRLHIPGYLWGPLSGAGSAYRRVLEEAPNWGIRRGVEIPVLPDREPQLRRLLHALDEIGVDFVNLNELEFSETNETNLHARGYALDPLAGWGVRGSRAVARRVLASEKLHVPVHFCSSRFKDGIQLRQRLLRQAELTSPPFAELTSDGTIRFGVIDLRERESLETACEELAKLGSLATEEYRLNHDRRRMELSAARLRDWAPRLRFPAFEVEEYPTADALEVEREPLNAAAYSAPIAGGGT